MSAIKVAVDEYVRVSRYLLEQTKTLSAVRRQKLELGEEILKYLVAEDSEGISSADVNLIKKDSKRTEGLKPDTIIDVLNRHGLDAKKLMDEINSSRKTSVKQVISLKKK
jgi:hypothetical protein